MTGFHNLKWVFILFFSSGVSGLIYQVVWVRMLTRIMGNTVYATSTVLAAFMAGLALGAYLFGRIIDRRQAKLKVYAQLEFAVGLFALVLPLLLNNFYSIYQGVHQGWFEESRMGVTMIQLVFSFACLLIPTTAMGATLPVLGAFVSDQASRYGHHVGVLYGLNTLGAVVGTLSSGLVLIGVFGEWATVGIGVAINIGVAIIAYMLYRSYEAAPSNIPVLQKASESTTPVSEKTVSSYPAYLRHSIVLVFMASGFVALGYEVVWTRLLQIYTGPSIYAFTMMLAIYLSGIALGSLIIAPVVDRFREPLALFGILELVLSLFGILGLLSITYFEYLDIGSYGLRMVLPTLLVVLPPTLVLGLIFPTVTRCYTRNLDQAGSSISHVYTLNTVGSILGSLAAGFWLIPAFGTTQTVFILAGINVLLGLFILFMTPDIRSHRSMIRWGTGLTVGIVALASVAPNPWYDILEHRIDGLSGGKYEIYYNREDASSTVTAFATYDPNTPQTRPNKHLWVNGYGMTVLITDTKLLAHIPLWHVPKPERALVICFGMGTTFKSAAQYPDLTVESIELSPRVFDCFPYYHPDTSVGPDGKKWIWIANDGRNHLLMSDTRYDMITIDPPPPIYGAGTVNLYTREFYELAKSRLTEQGVLSQWFPSETLLFEMKMLVKTFRSVFPNTLMWRGPDGNGLFVIGAEHPLKIDYARIEESFRNPDILRDLTEWDALVNSPETTLDQFVMSGPRIDEFVGDVPIITDNNPYTEFPFTLHLLYGRSPRTWDAWDEILRYREPVDPYLINDTRGGTQAQEP